MSDQTQKIVSPVDGSIYAERPIARDAEIEAAVSSARAALPEWKATPMRDRTRYVLAFLDALVAMNDDITSSSPGRWAGRFAMAVRSAPPKSACVP